MSKYIQPSARHKNHAKLARSGLYRGHTLPLSNYDKLPAVVQTNADYEIELLVNRMCPFARRVLYTLAYKGLRASISECDLVTKPDRLLQLNDKGTVPAMCIQHASTSQIYTDSLDAIEALD